LPGQVDLGEVWHGECVEAFSVFAAPDGKSLAASGRERAAGAADALAQAVRSCAAQLTDLVRSHARDRIRAAWDTPDHSGGTALAERLTVPAASDGASQPAASSVDPIAFWLGGIETAVVEHGDVPGLARASQAIGRTGLSAVAGAAALDYAPAERFLVEVGGEAGAAIVGVAVEALSAGLLTVARDVIDDAGRLLDEATPAEDIGPMLGGHAERFAKEAE
jgi:hypothetical protein